MAASFFIVPGEKKEAGSGLDNRTPLGFNDYYLLAPLVLSCSIT
jgi:hypothetical protein